VNAHGFVVGHDRGEAAIVVRYYEHVMSCFLTFVKDIPGYDGSRSRSLTSSTNWSTPSFSS